MAFLKTAVFIPILCLCGALTHSTALQAAYEQSVHQAIKTGDVSFLQNALKKDVSWLNTRGLYEELPLETAAFSAQSEVVDFLISNGADAKNSTTSYGDPVLCIVYQYMNNAKRKSDQDALRKYQHITRSFIKAGARCPQELMTEFVTSESI